MALTEAQFIALEGNIREVWDAYFKNPNNKDFISDLYNVITRKTAQFTDYTLGAPGRMHKWNGSVQYDSIETGYTKQYKPEKFDTGIQVERDLYEDGEYEAIKTRVNNIVQGVQTTLLYDGVAPFNGAFSTATLGPDSAALCSATHHLVPGDTAQSNTFTLSLDYDNLETILNAMENWVNDRGDKMLINGNMIIAGQYWRKTCKQLFGSDKEAYTADNQDNAYKDFSYMIHPLIDGKKFFVVNKEIMKGGSGLNWFMRKDPRNLERDGDIAKGDFNTEMLSWKAVGRWVKGWTNWHWVAGSNPA